MGRSKNKLQHRTDPYSLSMRNPCTFRSGSRALYVRSDWTLYEGDDYDCIKTTELKYLVSIWAKFEAILTTGGFDSCERVGNYNVIEKHGKYAPIRSAKYLLISVVCIFFK